jgi:hypothetical protein
VKVNVYRLFFSFELNFPSPSVNNNSSDGVSRICTPSTGLFSESLTEPLISPPCAKSSLELTNSNTNNPKIDFNDLLNRISDGILDTKKEAGYFKI